MGDRVSVQFVDKEENVSIAVFSHWDGMGFVEMAKRYVIEELPKRAKDGYTPLGRRDSDTVVIDFISYISGGKPIESGYYLGATGKDGDNSDNGNWIIDTDTGDARREGE